MRKTVLLFFCLAIAQSLFAQSQLYYTQVVKPEQLEEFVLMAVYDSASFVYIKQAQNAKPKKGEFTELPVYKVPDWYQTKPAKEIELDFKGLTNEYEIFGEWNILGNALSVFGLSSVYEADTNQFVKYDTAFKYKDNTKFVPMFNGNRYLKHTILLSKYKDVLNSANYAKLTGFIIDRINRDLRISTVNDSLVLSKYSLPIDTVILPQVNFYDFDYPLSRSILDHDGSAFADVGCSIPLTKRDVEGLILDTAATGPPDSLLLLVTVNSVDSFSIAYNWNYSFVKRWAKDEYPPLTLKRIPYSVGLHFNSGATIYLPYKDAMSIMDEAGVSSQGFNQCFEATFFKSLNFKLNRTLRFLKDR